MKALASLLLLAACSNGNASSTSLSANWFPSLPRADWPCASRGVNTDGTMHDIERYEYNGPSSCKLPTLLVTEGLVGCATKHGTTRITYDARDQMVSLGIFAFVWDDAPHEMHETLTTKGATLEAHRADGSLHQRVELDASRRPRTSTVMSRSGQDTHIEYAWDGARLKSVTLDGGQPWGTRYEMLYACDGL